TREIDLAANVFTRVRFTLPEPGEFRIDLDVDDACDQNNHATGEVFARSDNRQILALSKSFPRLQGMEVTLGQNVSSLRPYDAVILDNVALSSADQQSLAAWVRTGGGLILLGGPNSYAMGGWKGTPLEDLSPLRVNPDLKVAVVFGIDASGSMERDFESATQVLLEAKEEFDKDDDLIAMTFAEDAKIMEFSLLRKLRPTGGTSIIKGIEAARLHLEAR